MITLRVLSMFSGTLPSGETVTLHAGNERMFAEGDAQWLLAEYAERFEMVEQPLTAEIETVDEPGAEVEVAPDPTLVTKMTEVPADIEKFGVQARTGKGKSKKG